MWLRACSVRRRRFASLTEISPRFTHVAISVPGLRRDVGGPRDRLARRSRALARTSAYGGAAGEFIPQTAPERSLLLSHRRNRAIVAFPMRGELVLPKTRRRQSGSLRHACRCAELPDPRAERGLSARRAFRGQFTSPKFLRRDYLRMFVHAPYSSERAAIRARAIAFRTVSNATADPQTIGPR